MRTKDIRIRHGFWKAVAYGACRLLQRVMLFDLTHIMVKDAEEVEPLDNSSGVECRFLTAEEVRHFADDPTNDIDVALADRLELGYDFCFAGLLGDRLVGYCWLALDSIEPEHNRSGESHASGVAFSFPPDHAFRYKGFTHPDFRGRHIYQQIGMSASLAMQEKGIRYVISTAEAVNYSALKSSYRCGFERLGFCILAGLGDRALVLAPNLSDRGILIGRRAKVVERKTLQTPLSFDYSNSATPALA